MPPALVCVLDHERHLGVGRLFAQTFVPAAMAMRSSPSTTTNASRSWVVHIDEAGKVAGRDADRARSTAGSGCARRTVHATRPPGRRRPG